MKLHFKRALEEAKHLLTPEGKAESFLQSAITEIEKSKSVNDIDTIGFKLCSEKYKGGPTFYKLHCFYFPKRHTGRPSIRELVVSAPVYDYDEIISIYQIIEAELKSEGYSPKYYTSNIDESKYVHFIKGFNFKV